MNSSIRSVNLPASGLAYCQRAEDLLEALTEAVHELVRLHEQQFQALRGGDLDSTRFDDLIHMANQRKHEAKYAYVHHLETHQCSMT
jgi:hypothetical protein